MATKKIISIPSIIAAISFIYLAFCPLVINPILDLIMGNSFADVIRHSISSMLSLHSIICFWSYIIITVGIFTKFDKIAVAVSAALLWLGTLISFITSIINSFKYDFYRLSFTNVLSALSYMLAYFLVFAIALWLAVLFFKKKEIPKFLKIVAFAPVIIFALILFFTFFGNVSNIISYLTNGAPFRYFLNTLILNLSSIFNRLVLIIGYAAVIVKLTDLKKKPQNTVEISENVVIENVTAE